MDKKVREILMILINTPRLEAVDLRLEEWRVVRKKDEG